MAVRGGWFFEIDLGRGKQATQFVGRLETLRRPIDQVYPFEVLRSGIAPARWLYIFSMPQNSPLERASTICKLWSLSEFRSNPLVANRSGACHGREGWAAVAGGLPASIGKRSFCQSSSCH